MKTKTKMRMKIILLLALVALVFAPKLTVFAKTIEDVKTEDKLLGPVKNYIIIDIYIPRGEDEFSRDKIYRRVEREGHWYSGSLDLKGRGFYGGEIKAKFSGTLFLDD